MKNTIIALSLIAYNSLAAEESATIAQPKKPDTYRTSKAYEAIIYDTYKEAMPYYDKELPEAYKNVLNKFGLTPDDVSFYTAVRMDRFVEKVGTNIVLLRPNFFLYLTEEEQATHIAIQLSRIKSGDLSEIRTYNQTQKNLETLDTVTKTAALGALALHYRDVLYQLFQAGIPHAKSLVCSKTGAFMSTCALISACAHIMYQRQRQQERTTHELNVLDTVGSETLMKIRERQVVWGKHNASLSVSSWLRYQWHTLIAELGLGDLPYAQLQKYREHLASKNK